MAISGSTEMTPLYIGTVLNAIFKQQKTDKTGSHLQKK